VNAAAVSRGSKGRGRGSRHRGAATAGAAGGDGGGGVSVVGCCSAGVGEVEVDEVDEEGSGDREEEDVEGGYGLSDWSRRRLGCHVSSYCWGAAQLGRVRERVRVGAQGEALNL
jgi:hypothetical protein